MPRANPPERELLLRSCRAAGPAGLEELLAGPLEWPWVLSQAAENAVTPSLYLALRDRASVPEAVRSALREAFLRNVAHALRLASHLVEILGHLREYGVPALAYKGPALAAMAYGRVEMRCFADLDLLVPRAGREAARAALEAAGYRLAVSREKAARLLREGYHLPFAGRGAAPPIELHWAITAAYWPFPLDPARLWSGASAVEILGSPVPTLDRELTVLALCAHGAKERWPRLALVRDLAALAAQPGGLDWAWMAREAAAMGRTRVLLLGLWLAASLLHAPVPPALLAEARADRVVLETTGQIEDHLFSGDLPSGLAFHRYAWRVWNRWPDRLRYLRHAAAPLPARAANLLRPSAADGSLPAGLPWVWRPLRAVWQWRAEPRELLRRIANNL